MVANSSRATEQRPEEFGIGRLFWVMSDAIVAADIDTQSIVLWNPAATKLFGYTEVEAIGMALDVLVPAELRPAHHAGVERYGDGGAPVLVGGGPVEVTALTSTGEQRFIALTLSDVSTGADRRHVVAVIRDMTEIRQAQRDLQRINEAMQDFVAAASHDLRTPLASVLGLASTLVSSDALTDEEQREFLEAILRGAHRASRLVDDLLTISQIDADAVEVRTQPVGIARVTTDAASLVGVEVEVSVPSDVVALVDPHHLERILVNLLTNAKLHGRPPIEVTAEPTDRTVTVWVTDPGDGVDPAFAPRLFDRFARADAGSSGTGLGLSIVHGLALANAGEAVHEPSPGGGARLGVRLPTPSNG